MRTSSSPETVTVAEAGQILGKHPNCDRYAFGWRRSHHADWIIPRANLMAVLARRDLSATG
jgi:hypothetical protein